MGYDMKTLRNTIIALIALVSVPAMADNNNLVNVNVFVERMQFMDYRTVQMTAITEGLVIKDVVVNRGYCRGSASNPRQAFKLNYGQSVAFRYQIRGYSCDIAEIIVKTNKGDVTYKRR